MYVEEMIDHSDHILIVYHLLADFENEVEEEKSNQQYY